MIMMAVFSLKISLGCEGRDWIGTDILDLQIRDSGLD
jgi:hypothetical protein